MTISEWIREATRPILLKKDRKQAAQELADHFEDHCSALTARGKSPEQAEQDALAAMGDAKETGLLLRQAYQPVLSVLWKISRIVFLAVALLLLIGFMHSVPNDIAPDSYYEAEFNRQELYNPDQAVMQLSGSEEVQVGKYRISVESAYILPRDGGASDSIESRICIMIRLRFDHPRWMNTAKNPEYFLCAKDDLGNEYPNCSLLSAPVSSPYLEARATAITRTQDFLDIRIWGSAQPKPALPEHIDLIYDHAGCSFSIGINFSEVTP